MLKLNQLKMERLIKLYKLDRETLTSDIALAFALEAERTCRDVGPMDPACEYFKRQQLDFETLALCLEEAEQTSRQTPPVTP